MSSGTAERRRPRDMTSLRNGGLPREYPRGSRRPKQSARGVHPLRPCRRVSRKIERSGRESASPDAMQHPPAPNPESDARAPSGPSIRELVTQAQAGDRDALGRLFELHEPMMTRWARRRLGMPLRTLEETRDVLHDAYSVVMRKIGGFRMEDSKSFARWLRGIITRVVLQKAGSQYLRRRGALPDDMPVASPDLTPMTRVSLDELTRWRYRILKEFERMDRRIYRLRVHGPFLDRGRGPRRPLRPRGPDAVREDGSAAPHADAPPDRGRRPWRLKTGPPVEDIVAAFLLEREEGKNPNVDDWLARYPKHAEVLAKLLSDDTASPATFRRPTGRGTPGPKSAAPRSAATPDAIGLGPYEVLEHVSTAGGGTVYRARHREGGHRRRAEGARLARRDRSARRRAVPSRGRDAPGAQPRARRARPRLGRGGRALLDRDEMARGRHVLEAPRGGRRQVSPPLRFPRARAARRAGRAHVRCDPRLRHPSPRREADEHHGRHAPASP